MTEGGLSTSQVSLEPSPEQRRFATILEGGTWLSLVALLLAFAAYVSGLVPPLVPIEALPRYWGLHAAEFAARTGAPTGWRWIRFLGYGDFMTFVGITMLAALSVAGYAAILPLFVRKRDVAYTLIILAEILIILIAASGLGGPAH